jgi:hypothetical protein
MRFDNHDHGPEWVLALTLSRGGSGFTGEMMGAFWVGVMVRRFAAKNPKLDEVFMFESGWVLILTRQAKRRDVHCKYAEIAISNFFLSCDRGPNPWGIAKKLVPLPIGTYSLEKYRITRILPPEVDIERLFPQYKETEAWRKWQEDQKRILTADDMERRIQMSKYMPQD